MADQKITELTADAAPSLDDLVATVNDPAGTPANRKVTIGDLFVAGTLPLGTGTQPTLYRSGDDLTIAQRTNSTNRSVVNAHSFDANDVVRIKGNSGVVLANGVPLGWNDNASAAATGVSTGFERIAANRMKTYGGTGWLNMSPGRRRLVNSINVASTTMTNIGDLSIAVIAGVRYSFRIVLRVEDETAIDGLRFDLDGGSATMTSIWISYILYDSTGLLGGVQDSTALATDATYTTVTGKAKMEIEGCMQVNAAGTVIPRFAKNSGSTAFANCIGNSFCLYEEQVDP